MRAVYMCSDLLTLHPVQLRSDGKGCRHAQTAPQANPQADSRLRPVQLTLAVRAAHAPPLGSHTVLQGGPVLLRHRWRGCKLCRQAQDAQLATSQAAAPTRKPRPCCRGDPHPCAADDSGQGLRARTGPQQRPRGPAGGHSCGAAPVAAPSLHLRKLGPRQVRGAGTRHQLVGLMCRACLCCKRLATSGASGMLRLWSLLFFTCRN